MKHTLHSLALSALILAAASLAGCASNAKCPFMPEKKCASHSSCCKDGKMDCCKKSGSDCCKKEAKSGCCKDGHCADKGHKH